MLHSKHTVSERDPTRDVNYSHILSESSHGCSPSWLPLEEGGLCQGKLCVSTARLSAVQVPGLPAYQH